MFWVLAEDNSSSQKKYIYQFCHTNAQIDLNEEKLTLYLCKMSCSYTYFSGLLPSLEITTKPQFLTIRFICKIRTKKKHQVTTFEIKNTFRQKLQNAEGNCLPCIVKVTYENILLKSNVSHWYNQRATSVCNTIWTKIGH